MEGLVSRVALIVDVVGAALLVGLVRGRRSGARERHYRVRELARPVERHVVRGIQLEVKERTLDYGKTIDPAAARTFFQSLPKK